MKKTCMLLAAVIIISFLIRIVISWQNITVLVQKVLLDDSLYVISIARNIAWGNGVTYNGVDATNGFQPFWGFLLVPIFLATRDIYTAINLILTLSSIIDTLTVVVLFMLAKKLFDEKIGLLSATLYGLNPLIMFQTLCGIELVLYIFLLLTTIFFYISFKDKLNTKNSIFLGVLLGLTTLARMDGIFLVFVIIMDIILTNRKRWTKEIRKVIIIVLFASLLVLPWFLWSYVNFGTIVQSSAIAKYNMGHGIFPFFDLKEPKTFSETLSMIKENLIRAVGSLAHQLGVVDFNISIITIILSLVYLTTIVISLKNLNKLRLYLAFSILLILFYNLYLWGIQIRYLTPIIPLIIIMTSYGFYNLAIRIKKSDVIVTAFFVLFLLVIFYNGFIQWDHGYFSWQKEIYKDALWLRDNTTSSDSIGCFSAGIPIYFSERRVVNLDGVVNFKAIKALEKRDVIEYMKSENITIWIDSVYFNQTVTDEYLKGRKIDILKENIWNDFLGNDNLELIEKTEGVYNHLRGFDMLIVFFIARVN